MSPTIRVDDEVYALLQSEAEAFVDTPNTVLRRLLKLRPEPSATTANPPPPTPRSGEAVVGMLAKLVHDGLIEEGEQLLWERRNHGERHTARVSGGGQLRLEDGTVHDSPSAAARHLVGYEVNGWRVWKLARDGKSLDEVRSRRARGGGSGTPPPPEPPRPPSRATGSPDRRVTPQKEFRPFILQILREAGGVQQMNKILDEVERRMKHMFVKGDYATVTDGEVRWRNAARWERKAMVDDGLIKATKDTDRAGVWELTRSGMEGR